MPRLLVCGVDDSSGSREAVRVAGDLAAALEAELLLVHVGSVPVVPGASRVPGGPAQLAARAQEDAKQLLERIAQELDAPDTERRVALGSAVAVLSAIAADEQADLLVVGSRGQGHLRAALLGSVSAGLCRSAPCPVVVVPPSVAQRVLGPGEAATAANRP
jgi:nucleotide-binding universal stress UspA family protein